MRVAIVSESFLPQVNGVVNSVLRVAEHLERTGHEAVIIAPDAPRGQPRAPRVVSSAPVHVVPSMMFPGVASLPCPVPTPVLYRTLRDFQPDVVHLASPFVLGMAGAYAARRLQVPTIGVFQTDVAGFASSYGIPIATRAAWAYTRKLHSLCDLTLAPSRESIAALAEHGIPRVRRWARGVDIDRFSPSHVDPALVDAWRGDGEPKLVVGFVGRLAPEKHVERLASLADDARVQLVIVGDGPERTRLSKLLPTAIFTGELRGDALARAYASLDVFVHAGEHETFCQAIQEAMASGLPVIGPDAGGPRDLVAHCRTGYLLPPSEFSELLPAAIESLRNDGVRAEFGRVALATVRTRTWPVIGDELLGHYRDVAAGGEQSSRLAG